MQCFIKLLIMKQKKQNLFVVLLIFMLIWSILLNWSQSRQVERLMRRMDKMVNVQEDLSAHLDELEQFESDEYGSK